MNKVQNSAVLIARILMPILFIVAGWGKMHAYSATAAYMASAGVPSFFLPLTILLEFGGGLAIMFGFLTRTTAIITAVFTVLTALLFHVDFSVPVNQMMFMKNLTIAGGYLVLFAFGPGAFSIDRLLKKNW